MNRPTKWLGHEWWVPGGLALLGWLGAEAVWADPPLEPAGTPPRSCANGRSSSGCPKLPCGAIAAPPGTYVQTWYGMQAAKADLDNFVFYRNEFAPGKAVLGPYGSYHLNKVIKRLPMVPFPVLVQQDLDPALNEARRQVLVAAFLTAGIVDADARVAVGFPLAEGLYGDEAPRAYLRLINGGGRGGAGGAGIGAGGGFGVGAGGALGGAIR